MSFRQKLRLNPEYMRSDGESVIMPLEDVNQRHLAAKERRRLQNRIAQRNHRQRLAAQRECEGRPYRQPGLDAGECTTCSQKRILGAQPRQPSSTPANRLSQCQTPRRAISSTTQDLHNDLHNSLFDDHERSPQEHHFPAALLDQNYTSMTEDSYLLSPALEACEPTDLERTELLDSATNIGEVENSERCLSSLDIEGGEIGGFQSLAVLDKKRSRASEVDITRSHARASPDSIIVDNSSTCPACLHSNSSTSNEKLTGCKSTSMTSRSVSALPLPQAKYGKTPLHLGSENGYASILGTLLSNGAEIDALDDSGRTALHCGVQRGHLEVVQLLLSWGANPLIQDSNGLTVLHQAVQAGQEDIVKLLVDKGTNVNVRVSGGRVPTVDHAC